MSSKLEIRVYVVTAADGEVIDVKLNRMSATALRSANPGSKVLPIMANKRHPNPGGQ